LRICPGALLGEKASSAVNKRRRQGDLERV
jgi:hypothetical protein